MRCILMKKNGSVLVVALIVTTLLSISSVAVLRQATTEIRASEREVASLQDYYLADAAVERAIYELRYGPDVIDDNGSSGSNGLPDLYEQLHGLNSFSIAAGGPGPLINPPLTLSFVINGRTVPVDLVSVLPQHQNTLETFDPNSSTDAFIPLKGGSYGKPIFMDLNGDGMMEILIGTSAGEIHYFEYVQQGNNFVVREILDANGDPFITGLDGKLTGNLIAQDIDGNNNFDVVFNTDEGHVYRYEVDPNTGQLVLKWNYDIPGARETYWEPALGNLDGDADMEIVVSANDAGLAVLDSNGSVIRTIPATGYGYNAPPLIGDFDRDGQNEIVADNGGTLVCYESDGTIKWTYRVGLKVSGTTGTLLESEGKHIPDRYSDEFWAPSATMGDLDGDGYPEIVATSHGSGDESTRNTHTVILRDTGRTIVDTQDLNGNGDVTDMISVPDDVRVNLTPSAVANGFGDSLYELHSHRQPTIGDWNDDGVMEIFHGVCIDQVYMFNVDFDNSDGTYFDTSATQTDVDWNSGSYELCDFSGDGIADFPTGIGGSGDVHASPVFANVDSDPDQEIIFATMNGGGVGGSVLVMDNTINPATGKLNVWRQIQFDPSESFHSGVAVADLNQDGIDEVIMAGSEHDNYNKTNGMHYLYVIGLRGISFARTRITATASSSLGTSKQVSSIVDLGNPASPNPVITFQSWQE